MWEHEQQHPFPHKQQFSLKSTSEYHFHNHQVLHIRKVLPYPYYSELQINKYIIKCNWLWQHEFRLQFIILLAMGFGKRRETTRMHATTANTLHYRPYTAPHIKHKDLHWMKKKIGAWDRTWLCRKSSQWSMVAIGWVIILLFVSCCVSLRQL